MALAVWPVSGVGGGLVARSGGGSRLYVYAVSAIGGGLVAYALGTSIIVTTPGSRVGNASMTLGPIVFASAEAIKSPTLVGTLKARTTLSAVVVVNLSVEYDLTTIIEMRVP